MQFMSDKGTPILFIAHHFPPMGGPGVTRSLNFVKHLRQFGYEPIVVTIPPDDIQSSGYPIDETLSAQLPAGITIIRIPTNEPRKFRSRLQKMKLFRLAWFFLYALFWERSARWPDNVVEQVGELIRNRNIRLVYTSSGPFSSAFIGKRLKEQYGLKWVADLRDPFTDAYAWQFPGKLHWKFARRMEKKIFSQADELIMNTNAARNLFVKRGINKPEAIVTITNGY
jgi:hypothetical protein